MPTYDQLEAVSIFTRAKPPADSAEDQAHASSRLVDAVIAAAKEAGLETEKAAPNQATITGDKVRVHLTDGGPRGWPMLSPFYFARPRAEPRWQRIEGIEYDQRAKLFVGTSDDTSRHPVPGDPRTRRSAVAVVADAIVAMLLTEAPMSHGPR